MRRVRFLLDANVLVDAQARDFFLTAAELNLIDVRWSARILNETVQALQRHRGLSADATSRLTGALERAFPESALSGYEHLIETFDLPDPDDHHVAAAAVSGECDLLVTENVGDFPDSYAEAADILVARIDEAICYVVAASGPDSLATLVQTILRRLTQPPDSLEEYLKRLEQRAPMGAVGLGAAIGLDPYARKYIDIIDAEAVGSPQDAVQRFLRLVEIGAAAELASMVDPAFAAHIAQSSEWSYDDVLASIATLLTDVFEIDGWGFATARRLIEPDVEIVKLVRAGTEPVATLEQSAARQHLFWLRRENAGWVLFDLDGGNPAPDSR